MDRKPIVLLAAGHPNSTFGSLQAIPKPLSTRTHRILFFVSRLFSILTLLFSFISTLLVLLLPGPESHLSVLAIHPTDTQLALNSAYPAGQNVTIVSGPSVLLDDRQDARGLFDGMGGPSIWIGVMRKYYGPVGFLTPFLISSRYLLEEQSGCRVDMYVIFASRLS